jgi:hypothetical protein
MPEYDMPEDQVYDREGNPLWKCTCFLRSPYMTETSYKSSKKLAKKMAAYKCICNITDAPAELKEHADMWLRRHGMSSRIAFPCPYNK